MNTIDLNIVDLQRDELIWINGGTTDDEGQENSTAYEVGHTVGKFVGKVTSAIIVAIIVAAILK